ncbi:MAG TPA: FxLYD domain-containing protein [Candidatus Eisenbacteria bacterium]|nr:FxLYD domain-containing protein [Candidatus Eisenbacteria bacterium]
MSEANLLKCACDHCCGSIEFPAEAEGANVACPHCGARTFLSAASPNLTEDEQALAVAADKNVRVPTQSKTWHGWVWGGLILVLVATAVALVYSRKAKLPKQVPTLVATPAPKRPKSLSDLKAGEIILEATQGTKLIHAVGTLANDSDYQRFGVKVELDLLDRDGRKVGTATDYVQILEPHREWRFRAMVLDRRAASARLTAIKEE